MTNSDVTGLTVQVMCITNDSEIVATRPPLPFNRSSDERNSRPAGSHREYYGRNESTGSTGHRGSYDALSRRHR
jgi:hypothetical protein